MQSWIGGQDLELCYPTSNCKPCRLCTLVSELRTWEGESEYLFSFSCSDHILHVSIVLALEFKEVNIL